MKTNVGAVSDMSGMQESKHLQESGQIFAFRYALKRFTGAPLLVVNYILANEASLTTQTKEEMVRDIEREKRMGTKMTDDWDRLLECFKKENKNASKQQ